MNSYFPPPFRYILRLLFLYLLLIFPVSALLPYCSAFENGPIENTQAAILLGGALLCVWFSCISLPNVRKMWLAVSGLFLLLSLRELSWGRVFFRRALYGRRTGHPACGGNAFLLGNPHRRRPPCRGLPVWAYPLHSLAADLP